MVDCPECSASLPDVARFCSRCGTPLHRSIDRLHHFAARPDEPVRAWALMSTLMPHLSGSRLYVYRDVIGLAVLAALVAAAFGVLSVALVMAAVALPAALLTYIHDHGVWRGDPLSVIGLGLLLSLVLGVAVGLLQRYLAVGPVLLAAGGRLPSVTTVLGLGVLLPVVVFVAVLVAPVMVTMRAAFQNPVDTLVICTLSGAAFSLGLSVVIQRDTFISVTSGAPTHVAFIALNLGFLQPVVVGTAAAVAVMRLRRAGASTALGVLEGLVLVLVYELATTLLAPYGDRGVVLTTVVAAVVAGAGLLVVRGELHTGLLAEAQAALKGGKALSHPAGGDQICAHCRAVMSSGVAFCQACGTATAALARPSSGASWAAGAGGRSAQLSYADTEERLENRLRVGMIALIVVLVVAIAAAVTIAVVVTNKEPAPQPPQPGPSGQMLGTAAAAAPTVRHLPGADSPAAARVTLTAGGTPALAFTAAGEAIDLGYGISLTPADGWTIDTQGKNLVVLWNDEFEALFDAVVHPVAVTDVEQLLADLIAHYTEGMSLTNVQLSQVKTATLNSKNFQKMASRGFTADYSTQQGSGKLYGMFAELLNTSTGLAAFAILAAYTRGSFKACVADGNAMITSML